MTITGSARILNVAHRGARAFAPENTLDAFAKAKTLGCEMFEMDVRLSKDGEIVVYHDEDLLRCSDAKSRFPDRSCYNIADFSFEELRQLDAGSWYIKQLELFPDERQVFLQSLSDSEVAQYVSPADQKHYASGDVKIPRLEETLSLAKELELMVNIEIKGRAEEKSGLVTKLLRVIKSMAFEDQILVTAFEHDWLRQICQQTKKVKTGVLTGNPIHAPIDYLRKLSAKTYNLGRYENFNENIINDLQFRQYLAQIKQIREAGFDLYVWTYNDREEMEYLFAMGITGMITDYPNRVREQLDQFINKHE